METLNWQQQDHAIFSNILIMDEIMKRMNVVDLLTCRKTNFNLFFAANEILRKQNLLSLLFKFDWKLNTYILSDLKLNIQDTITEYTECNHATDLDSFTKLLNTSVQQFPCTRFAFMDGDLNSKGLQNFLNYHGYYIRDLSLDVFRKPEPEPGLVHAYNYENIKRIIPTFGTLWKLLIVQAPNMNSFSVGYCPKEWRQFYCPDLMRLFPQQFKHLPKFQLPYLKRFTYGITGEAMSFRVFEDILLAAPNLQIVETMYIPFLLESNRFHLLQWFKFYPCHSFNKLYKTVFSPFAMKPLQLKTLVISLHDIIQFPQLQESARDTLNILLSACASRLKTFELTAPLGLLGVSFQLPRFPTVTSFTIRTDRIVVSMIENQNLQINQNPLTLKYFPAGFQFSQTFPLLTCVTFSFKTFTEQENWEDFFFDLDEVPSVKYLTFTEFLLLPVNCLSYCSRIFVNLEFLCMKVICLKYGTLSGLWGFKRLKELNCHIYMAQRYNICPYLDAAFTGFSPETCRRLQNPAYVEQFEVDELEYFRINPSILQLLELRQLNLTFSDRFLNSLEHYPTMFTYVTSSTFLKCPQLQVAVRMEVRSKQNSQHILRAIDGILPAVQLQDITLRD